MSEINKKIIVFVSFNADITATLKHFPKAGESVLSDKSNIGPGGKGTNQALSAAKSGGDVHFITKIGMDTFGQLAEDVINASDIASKTLLKSESLPTGRAMIYVSQHDNDNMLVVFPGANASVNDNDITCINQYLVDSEILLIQGENNLDATEKLVKIAYQHHKTIILNPAPYSEGIKKILPFTDIVTPNESEASLLSGLAITDIKSAELAARKISAMGPKTVLITLGARGVLIFDQQHFTHLAAFDSNPIDTTGAGDAFNGALVAGLAAHKNIIESASWASAFASLAIEREGAANHPEISDVNERLLNRKS